MLARVMLHDLSVRIARFDPWSSTSSLSSYALFHSVVSHSQEPCSLSLPS